MANKISKKPVANYWRAKSVNIYFDESIDKKFKVLNLEHLSLVDFFIAEEIIESSQTVFVLKCNMIYENTINYAEEKDSIVLATFNTKKEAEEALKKIRVAITKPNKIFYKFIGMILVTLMIATIGVNIFYTIKDNKALSLVQKQDSAEIDSSKDNQSEKQAQESAYQDNSQPKQLPLPQIQMGEGQINMDQVREMTQQIQKQVQEEADRQMQENIQKFRAMQSGQNVDGEQGGQPQQQVKQPPNPADSLLDRLK